MQKYYTGSLIHLHKCGVGANPSAFPAGCELYPAKEVDSALAAKAQRISELDTTVGSQINRERDLVASLAAKDARIAELCQRLDKVHALAIAGYHSPERSLQLVTDLTIGYGPAESHEVVE